MFALIDCNNFYVSCERAFNPRLENKPVIVLSNNDGCIISRSNEAKKLKIPMGAPFHQWQAFCKRHHVFVFSSNYELYGDMSQRVMLLLNQFNESMEIYSIDEAFLFFKEKIGFDELIELRNYIKMSTGIPISIGLGPTKTLAKVANSIAKISTTGVYIFSGAEDSILSSLPVDKVWGVGHAIARRLQVLHIDTAQKLQQADPKMIRLHFSVTLEKTVQELNGIPCLSLEDQQPRKQIVSSRAFGQLITRLEDLEEAVSHFIHRATKKLRKQFSSTSGVYVFLQTNVFNAKQPQYANGVMYPIPFPTNNTGYLITIAKKCLRHIYKTGYQYHKAGIMLLELTEDTVKQYDMFLKVINEKDMKLMQTIDKLNKNFGKNTIFYAAEGIKRNWEMRSKKLSFRYTTRWTELPRVKCR